MHTCRAEVLLPHLDLELTPVALCVLGAAGQEVPRHQLVDAALVVVRQLLGVGELGRVDRRMCLSSTKSGGHEDGGQGEPSSSSCVELWSGTWSSFSPIRGNWNLFWSSSAAAYWPQVGCCLCSSTKGRRSWPSLNLSVSVLEWPARSVHSVGQGTAEAVGLYVRSTHLG